LPLSAQLYPVQLSIGGSWTNVAPACIGHNAQAASAAAPMVARIARTANHNATRPTFGFLNASTVKFLQLDHRCMATGVAVSVVEPYAGPRDSKAPPAV
jgi:hypothetical protein